MERLALWRRLAGMPRPTRQHYEFRKTFRYRFTQPFSPSDTGSAREAPSSCPTCPDAGRGVERWSGHRGL